VNNYDLTVKEVIRVSDDCIKKEKPFAARFKRKYMTIAFMTDGTFCCNLKSGVSFKAQKGETLILFVGDQDVFTSQGEQACSVYVDIDVEMDIPEGLLPRVCRVDGMHTLFKELTACWNGCQPGYKIRSKEIIYKIINTILKEQISKSDTLLKYRKIKPAILKIESDFSKDITVEQLALLCNMSPSNLTRLFFAVTGKTPIQYLRNARISYAKAEISRGEQDLTSLSERCGYADIFSFSRSFKKVVGISPSKYI
jgi:AraC-like DNA-binding protein